MAWEHGWVHPAGQPWDQDSGAVAGSPPSLAGPQTWAAALTIRSSCSPVHPPEELQGVPAALPCLQLHLLLPAGAAAGPAPGRGALGLRGQQVRGGLGGRQGQLLHGPDNCLSTCLSSTHSSWDCGLFSNYSAPWQVVPELVALRLPLPGQRALHYLSSHAFSFPLLILLRCLAWRTPGTVPFPWGWNRTGQSLHSLVGSRNQARVVQGSTFPKDR